jgi:hypothetical protein
MSRLQALREQKVKLAVMIRQQADRLTAEGYTETAEDSANWEKLNADYNATCRQIERLEAADAVEAGAGAANGDRIPAILPPDERPRGGAGAGAVSERHRELALQAWARRQFDIDLTDEHREACAVTRLNPGSREIGLSLYGTRDLQSLQREFRRVHPSQAVDHCTDRFKATLGSGSGPTGGYLDRAGTTPVEPRNQHARLRRDAAGRGDDPHRDRRADELADRRRHDQHRRATRRVHRDRPSVDPSFGKVLWSAYKFSSKPVLVPYELLQDSRFNLAGLIGSMLGERLGRITNTKFTTGTGAATAKGIVTCATSFSAASARPSSSMM